MTPINWDAMHAEGIHHLRELLRLDTTNPPGNESRAAAYLAQALASEGIDSVQVGHAPGRDNLVARLKGRGDAPPLLLMGHTDVVPAEPEHWTHPPFAGEVADGYLWGRGAIDMKFMVAMELMTVLTLKRQGVELARDVIFVAAADEEVSSAGIRYLAQAHPDLIRAEYAINEGGGVTQWIAGKPFYTIQVGEKGVCWTRIHMRGRPGHAALPLDNNAVSKLARALAGMRPMPQHITPTVRVFLDTVGQSLDGDGGERLSQMLEQEQWPELARRVLEPEMAAFLYAITHNTAVPTGLKAGYKTNVIPSTAEATLDCRFLPGFDPETFLKELRAAFPEDLAADMDIEVVQHAPALEAPFDSPLYRLMKSNIEAMHPGAVAAPYILAGATDAKYVQPLGIRVYGFAPLRFERGDRVQGVHGHDERIPLEGFAVGLRTFYETVREFAMSGA